MSPKTFSVATLSFLSAVLVGLIMMAGCGGGSSSSSSILGSPAVTLSPTSLSFSSGVGVQSAAQSVTVTDSGSATLTFSGISVSPSSFAQTNTCGTAIAEGATCTISVTFTPSAAGTVSGTLTITDNASNSPQTVTLSGTGNTVFVSPTSLTFSGVAVGTTSAPQSVTLNNVGTTAVAITSITTSGDFSVSSNDCGSSLAASGTCTISVTFAPQGSGPWTGTLTIVDAAGTQTAALTGTTTVANTVPVTVGFGPLGQSGGYVNGIFTTVTVCAPGTTNCATIPNVLVDTGSVGLRLLSTGATGATTQVGNLNLPQVTDPVSGNPMFECVEYGDLSYTWGPMQMATVQIGGETASQVPAASGGTANSGIPIQVITTTNVSNIAVDNSSGTDYYAPCLINPATDALSGGLDDDSVTNLGSNGILGIGVYQQDCGTDCTAAELGDNVDIWWYMYCNSSASPTECDLQYAPLTVQAWNPVPAFSSSDTNGVVLNLPSVPASGQATATGTLTFGIGTESNNAINGQTIYELDEYGNFASLSFNGVTYTSTNSYGSFLDSGSNALFVSDPTTLTTATGVTTSDCSAFYCPSSTLSLNITLSGSNGTSGPATLSIANADSLFSNPSYAVFDNLGGPTLGGTGPSTDQWDLGLPFWFDRTIFVGIAGTSTTYPNGYWAF